MAATGESGDQPERSTTCPMSRKTFIGSTGSGGSCVTESGHQASGRARRGLATVWAYSQAARLSAELRINAVYRSWKSAYGPQSPKSIRLVRVALSCVQPSTLHVTGSRRFGG